MTIISIDAGGTNIKMGLVQQEKIIARGVIPAVSENGLGPWLTLIENEAHKLLEENNIGRESVRGVGLSIPGIIDVNAMKVLDINDKYNDIMKLNLPEWAKSAWGIPFVMEGDARSALVGTWQYGSGKGFNNLVLITLGTGIGSAVIFGGQVLYGKHFQAGILGGHFIVDLNGNKCNCGNVGCAEAHASSWQLPKLIREHQLFESSKFKDASNLNFETCFNLANEGDECALSIRNYCIDVWSTVVINMIYAYDPEMVILAGGVMKSAEVIMPTVQQKINEMAWTPSGQVKIVKEEHMDDAALLRLDYLLKKRYNL